jgi:hypothetical protein
MLRPLSGRVGAVVAVCGAILDAQHVATAVTTAPLLRPDNWRPHAEKSGRNMLRFLSLPTIRGARCPSALARGPTSGRNIPP